MVGNLSRVFIGEIPFSFDVHVSTYTYKGKLAKVGTSLVSVFRGNHGKYIDCPANPVKAIHECMYSVKEPAYSIQLIQQIPEIQKWP